MSGDRFKPTAWLRFVERREEVPKTGYFGGATETVSRLILQQQWVATQPEAAKRLGQPETEWRDVPLSSSESV